MRPAVLKLLLCAVLLAFVSYQIYLTVEGTYNWPFSANDFFAFTDPAEQYVPKVRLIDEEGASIDVHPGRTIPVEFFRAVQMLVKVFWGSDEPKKSAFASNMLATLNARPWAKFDETYAAARVRPGHRFTKLQVILVQLTVNLKTGTAYESPNVLVVYTFPQTPGKGRENAPPYIELQSAEY